MINLALATALIGLAMMIAVQTMIQFRSRLARLNFWGTYPKLEASRLDDTLGFWLILFSRVLIVIALAYFASILVVQT